MKLGRLVYNGTQASAALIDEEEGYIRKNRRERGSLFGAVPVRSSRVLCETEVCPAG